ncbi:MAG: hypothetical protein ACKOYM_09790, partial [Actinomycetes bacterium]
RDAAAVPDAAVGATFHHGDVATPSPGAASDPHGLSALLASQDHDEVEHAVVPLAVCAVLLDDGESVDGVVLGEMLGQPAVIVVTQRRVLAVNGRRWRPVVDEFRFSSAVQVRGRHDAGIAAVTLLDDERLVTIDRISDLDAARHLTDIVRSRCAR